MFALIGVRAMTAQEIAESLGLRETAVNGRLNELKREGLAEIVSDATGEPVRRASVFADGRRSDVRHQQWRTPTRSGT